MQKKTKIIWSIIAALFIIYLYTHLSAYWEDRSSRLGKAVTVAVSPVLQKNVVVPLQAVGTVEAYSTVSVKSLVDGELIQTGFKEGDFVKKGQLLFSIDPRPYQAELTQAEANLARSQAQLDIANSEVKRNQPLVQKGYVAKEDFDQLQSNQKAAVATVSADQAAVTSAQLELSYATILSPIDGRTGDLQVYPGNIIKTANGTILVTIAQVTPIYVSFSIPQQYLDSVRAQLAQGNVEVQALADGVTEKGQLTFINNTVDTTTGTIQLKATFANAQQRLWPGQFVTVTLPTATIPHALLIPSTAVQMGQNGAYVYVLMPDDTVAYRSITLGAVVNDDTVILQGLSPSEQVVTEGQLRLSDGSPVKVPGVAHKKKKGW
jgi:multidrug efflux system membrane fusion protein